MAQKVNVILVDDLDGTEMDRDSGHTVSFALDGTEYEIDLSEKNAAALRKAFSKYVEAARKVSRSNVGARRTGNRTNRLAVVRDGEHDPKEVRAWAVEKGLMKAEARGRIPNSVLDEYKKSLAS